MKWRLGGCPVRGQGLALAHDQLEDPQEDASTDQAGDEAEDPATAADTDEGEEPAAEEATDDADDDVGQQAHLGVGAHDLRADPTGETTDDDPAEEAECGNARF